MTGPLGNYADLQVLHGADLNADSATLAANDVATINVLLGGWNALVSGCTLTATGGLGVGVAAGEAIANGVILPISAGSVTLGTNSGQVNPRIDVIYAQLVAGGTSGTNPGSGNPTKADTYTLGVQPGTNAASPVAPSLSNNTYVQLGTVTVPAGATSLTGANLNSQVTAPNAQGPLGPVLVNLLLHLAANITSSATVHGIRQGSGNGLDSDTVDGEHAAAFQPAGSYDAAGAAAAVAGNLTSESSTRASADTVLTNALNAHEAADLGTATVHNLRIQHGITGTEVTDSNGNATFTVTFPSPFTVPPTVVPGVVNFKPGNASVCEAQSVTVNGCTIQLGFASNSGATVQASWIAVGS